MKAIDSTVWFARRKQDNPWWHIHRIDADGQNHRQVTHGSYHDVHRIEMPSGRIAFSSSRLGNREERQRTIQSTNDFGR